MAAPIAASELYLDLLKKRLTRYDDGPTYFVDPPPRRSWTGLLYRVAQRLVSPGFTLTRLQHFDEEMRRSGKDWPVNGETMIGLRRLDDLHDCIRDVLQRGVPGDFIETGVWRGGATIFMRAALEAYGDTTRRVWVADSFQGLPQPDPRYPADSGNTLWNDSRLAASVDEVKANFARYGLLDDRVRFLVGWFRDTLPSAPIDRLAILRLDGDLYESTMDGLRSLYPKLSVGGYIIIDDYQVEALGCRQAVDEFRAEHGITDPIQVIDWAGVFWQRLR